MSAGLLPALLCRLAERAVLCSRKKGVELSFRGDMSDVEVTVLNNPLISRV